MQSAFDTSQHTMIQSSDGSFTAYSSEYNEHYHSTKDGALQESLQKHVIPALSVKKEKQELNILDICFGLGFNTLATLDYVEREGLGCKVKIYSPELDSTLVRSLPHFEYPREFEKYRDLLSQLVQTGHYSSDSWDVELFVGDAREYIKSFENHFDIVYQDAFSPATNPVLWTQEYFADIAKAMKSDGILTTYSIALSTRLALYENGFRIYLNEGEGYRKATIASLGTLEGFEPVDMEHKIACNPKAKSLRD
jgi:tRNA U34 5-methylaminomethyl-2-thiouridine-forming methyltransferase MnmC